MITKIQLSPSKVLSKNNDNVGYKTPENAKEILTRVSENLILLSNSIIFFKKK